VEEVPMLRLANLLAVLFDEQHPLIATTTTTTRRKRRSSHMMALSLLILLVRLLHCSCWWDACCDTLMTSTSSHALLALGNLLSPQVLGKHEWIWWPFEAELWRFLPANSMMLIAMLPPSSSSFSLLLEATTGTVNGAASPCCYVSYLEEGGSMVQLVGTAWLIPSPMPHMFTKHHLTRRKSSNTTVSST
jgi:hypothetical protein